MSHKRRRPRVEPAPTPGVSRPLGAIRRAEDEELRVEWCWFEGHPFVSARLWVRGSRGKWFPDPKRGLSIRLREMAIIRDALAKADRLATAYHQGLQRGRNGPVDAPRQAARTPCQDEPSRPSGEGRLWDPSGLPVIEPSDPENGEFDEFD
jgi:hypothetical protein